MTENGGGKNVHASANFLNNLILYNQSLREWLKHVAIALSRSIRQHKLICLWLLAEVGSLREPAPLRRPSETERVGVG
jgi:hypothetical protein